MDATPAILDEISFIVKHADTDPAVPVREKVPRIHQPAAKNQLEFLLLTYKSLQFRQVRQEKQKLNAVSHASGSHLGA
jgi:hypothetical protein